jgi:hypothetical protein
MQDLAPIVVGRKHRRRHLLTAVNRSLAAHGRAAVVAPNDARRHLHWLRHRLLERGCEWEWDEIDDGYTLLRVWPMGDVDDHDTLLRAAELGDRWWYFLRYDSPEHWRRTRQ